MFIYTDSIVIYGLDLNVMCTIQALHGFGIDYSRFILVSDKNVNLKSTKQTRVRVNTMCTFLLFLSFVGPWLL